jgi:ABC-type sugar transport system permease subunit
MKNFLIKTIFLAILLFSNIGFTAEPQELYTFDAPTIDKIIVDAERCIATNKNLSVCEEMVKLVQDKLRLKEEQLSLCEATLSKKDELYDGLSNIKNTQLKLCEETSKKKDAIIQEKQEILDDVQAAIDKEKSRGFWSKLWSNMKWTSIGTILGIIIGGVGVALL